MTVAIAVVPGPFALEGVNHAAELHNGVGYYRQQQGRVAEALAEFEQAVAVNPEFAEAHRNLASALGLQNRWQEAVSHFERAVALKPYYVEARRDFATALEALGQHGRAIADCARSRRQRVFQPKATRALRSCSSRPDASPRR